MLNKNDHPLFDLIAFDADDTLWHTERLYLEALDTLIKVIPTPMTVKELEQYLYQKETVNINLYGYGIKSYTLSMIETAIELGSDSLKAGQIQQILELGKGMLGAQIQLLPHVEETLRALQMRYNLMVITKGELLEQEAKLKRSGVAGYFRSYEVVSVKNQATYHTLLQRHGVEPQRFLMIGNSLKSDILPVLELGGHALHIPYEITWAHELVDEPLTAAYYELEHIGQLPNWLEMLEQNESNNPKTV